jgi:hypothetical protein
MDQKYHGGATRTIAGFLDDNFSTELDAPIHFRGRFKFITVTRASGPCLVLLE